MKKVVIFIVTIIMCLFMAIGLSACNSIESNYADVEISGSRFTIIAKDNFDSSTIYTVYDKDTLIMYAIVRYKAGYAGGVSITVMYNENGQPLLYKGET